MKTLLVITILLPLFVGAASADDAAVHYNRDVRPILSENCFFCHGFDKDKRKADLRIDTREGAIDGGAIVPGDAGASELIYRLTADDEDDVMPPHDSVYKLTAEQIGTLTKWVEQGAIYEDHWAYTPVKRPEGEGIDDFIDRKLGEKQIAPSPAADPAVLKRRLSFDLRGLPPGAGDLERSYEELVETYLADPAFAETIASRWLDLVRWADTSGLVSDEPIDTTAYRAYVIDAFHKNKPFDEFTIEQLAGDLIEKPTDESLVASGYNRLVKTNSEAGVIEDEAYYALKGEHVRALGSVWLGSSIGCAECHDHKYDPILQKDYYTVAAFFDDLVETANYSPGDRRVPLHYVHDEAKKPLVLALETQLSAKEAAHYGVPTPFEDEKLARYIETKKKELSAAKEKGGLGDFVQFPAAPPASYVKKGEYILQKTEHGKMRKQNGRLLIGETDRTITFPNKENSFFVDVWIDPEKRPDSILVQFVQGGYGRIGWKRNVYDSFYWGENHYEKARYIDPKKLTRIGDIPESGYVRLEIPREKFKLVENKYWMLGMAWDARGGDVLWGDSGYTMKSERAMKYTLGAQAARMFHGVPIIRDLYEKKVLVIADALGKTNPETYTHWEREGLRRLFLDSENPQARAEIDRLDRELMDLRRDAVPALVSKVGTSYPEKITKVLPRGNFQDQSGSVAKPGIPEFLGKLPEGATRLDLARWLVDGENPLTARTFINRLWQQYFGRGISDTLDDLGSQGVWPSHPELLDWLADEFVASGWDVKHMVRLMVKSAVYRRSSVPRQDLAETDPLNKLHARQARFRLPAEAVRDVALETAGLLNRADRSRESFFPYQPATYWDHTNKIMYGSRFMDYNPSLQKTQHRRSIYTFWKRNGTHPTLLAFDAPTRMECTAKRSTTNTPGQALVLLNDPIFVEAARGLAQRVLVLGQVDRQMIEMAFSLAIGREPQPGETEILQSLLESQRTHFAGTPADADALTATGETARPGTVELPELAAWTTVCRAILNLHEAVTRF